MSRRVPFSLLLLLCSACGGGGGGGTPPSSNPARLAADDLDLGPQTQSAELVVRLDDAPVLPTLLQVAIELPSALVLPSADRLIAAAPVVTLDGEMQDERFVVLCGDAQNPDASPMPRGPLFRLRLLTSTPRQPGTHAIRLHEVRAAAEDGTVIATDANPVTVNVTIR
jgi:hypothetical protein